MENLNQIIRDTLDYYVAGGSGFKMRLFPVFDDDHQTYTVLAFDYPAREAEPGIVVMLRVVGDTVVVEEDASNKPVLDRLEANGIPRDKIILAYAGEPVPDPIEMP
jgi:hypothetical protein